MMHNRILPSYTEGFLLQLWALKVLFGICGRGYMIPARSITQWPRNWEAPDWAGSAWELVACTPQSHRSTRTDCISLGFYHPDTNSQTWAKHFLDTGGLRDGARQTSVLKPFESMLMGLNRNIVPYCTLLYGRGWAAPLTFCSSLQVNAPTLSRQNILRRCWVNFKFYLQLRS